MYSSNRPEKWSENDGNHGTDDLHMDEKEETSMFLGRFSDGFAVDPLQFRRHSPCRTSIDSDDVSKHCGHAQGVRWMHEAHVSIERCCDKETKITQAMIQHAFFDS